MTATKNSCRYPIAKTQPSFQQRRLQLRDGKRTQSYYRGEFQQFPAVHALELSAVSSQHHAKCPPANFAGADRIPPSDKSYRDIMLLSPQHITAAARLRLRPAQPAGTITPREKYSPAPRTPRHQEPRNSGEHSGGF